jgi:hypothetical protein
MTGPNHEERYEKLEESPSLCTRVFQRGKSYADLWTFFASHLSAPRTINYALISTKSTAQLIPP